MLEYKLKENFDRDFGNALYHKKVIFEIITHIIQE